jgi:hypothetical protein
MTSPNPHDLPRIDEQRCWDLLRSHPFGRLAVAAAGVIDIYPVNHGVLDRGLYFRTAEGTKLASVVIGRDVAFEIDEVARRRRPLGGRPRPRGRGRGRRAARAFGRGGNGELRSHGQDRLGQGHTRARRRARVRGGARARRASDRRGPGGTARTPGGRGSGRPGPSPAGVDRPPRNLRYCGGVSTREVSRSDVPAQAKGKTTGKSLLIVESPSKVKTIGGYLGDAYVVESSMGHIRDLPPAPRSCRPSSRRPRWASSRWTSRTTSSRTTW